MDGIGIRGLALTRSYRGTESSIVRLAGVSTRRDLPLARPSSSAVTTAIPSQATIARGARVFITGCRPTMETASATEHGRKRAELPVCVGEQHRKALARADFMAEASTVGADFTAE